MTRPALHITSRRFKIDKDRVGVFVPAKPDRPAKDADYVWRIFALEGSDTGRQIGIATQVALTGPVGCMPANRMITGYLAPEPVWLTSATHQVDGIWAATVTMKAAVLTSDGEVWTVSARHPQARVRFWDKDFNEIDFPSRWRIEVVSG